MHKKYLAGVAILIAIVASAWYVFRPVEQQSADIPHASSTDVGEYATPAPSVDPWEGWETAVDAEDKLIFRYPRDLGTQFIQTVDWPPVLQRVGDVFSCADAGSVTARGGRTEVRTVAGRTYCVTQTDEGAAGSVYSQYAYAFPYGENTAIFTFTLRAPQCGNYDEGPRALCEAEKAAFNPDMLVDTIAQSLTAQ